MRFTPLILAAGESSRMGTPKALLDFDGLTCLDLVLRACRRPRCTAPLVVVGAAADRIRAALPAGTAVVDNPGFRHGQTSSLKTGLRSLPPDADGFLLFPVDFPLVRSETVDRILTTDGAIVIPLHAGRRGHPARFGAATVAEFLALGDDEPAHRVVRRDPDRVVEVPVDDEAVVMRMNTPAEYRDCLRIHRLRTGTAAPPRPP